MFNAPLFYITTLILLIHYSAYKIKRTSTKIEISELLVNFLILRHYHLNQERLEISFCKGVNFSHDRMINTI